MKKSDKYRKHYVSKREFPTRVVRNGNEGTLVVGHTKARKAVEERIGRKLSDATTVKTCAGNWVFLEPREA